MQLPAEGHATPLRKNLVAPRGVGRAVGAPQTPLVWVMAVGRPASDERPSVSWPTLGPTAMHDVAEGHDTEPYAPASGADVPRTLGRV